MLVPERFQQRIFLFSPNLQIIKKLGQVNCVCYCYYDYAQLILLLAYKLPVPSK